MNDKEALLNTIIDNVIDCCKVDTEAGTVITKDGVLGKARNENLVMTRCIIVKHALNAGFATETIARMLGRTTHAVRHLLELGGIFERTSKAYRTAEAEAKKLNNSL